MWEPHHKKWDTGCPLSPLNIQKYSWHTLSSSACWHSIFISSIFSCGTLMRQSVLLQLFHDVIVLYSVYSNISSCHLKHFAGHHWNKTKDIPCVILFPGPLLLCQPNPWKSWSTNLPLVFYPLISGATSIPVSKLTREWCIVRAKKALHPCNNAIFSSIVRAN